MRADLSLDRFSPTRRQALLGGAAAILTAGAGREARAAAGTVVVSNWGGDWNQRTVRFVETPLVEAQGLTVVRDLGMEPERKAKLLAERRLRRGSIDVIHLNDSDGFEIPLAASEFELLRTFAERPGRTLTREMLLELAHPHGEDRFDRSIDVRITRIRKKIEAVPSRPQVIRTVRGIGYVFDPSAER